jgi:hypothetical protein
MASDCRDSSASLHSNGNMFIVPLHRNGHCLQSHCLAEGLYTKTCPIHMICPIFISIKFHYLNITL